MCVTSCKPDMGPDVHHASQLFHSLTMGSEVCPTTLFSVSLLTLPSHSLRAFVTSHPPRLPSYLMCPSLSLHTPLHFPHAHTFLSCMSHPHLLLPHLTALIGPPILTFTLSSHSPHTCLTILSHPPFFTLSYTLPYAPWSLGCGTLSHPLSQPIHACPVDPSLAPLSGQAWKYKVL